MHRRSSIHRPPAYHADVATDPWYPRPHSARGGRLRTVVAIVLASLAGVLGYGLFWPIPASPVAWTPPDDDGYTGPHATNRRLEGVARSWLPDLSAPRDLAAVPDGTVYATTAEGVLVYRPRDADTFVPWLHLGGRPLGIDWDEARDRLVVADAADGLWAVTRDRRARRLTREVDGTPIRFANDVVAARDGTLFLTDATQRRSGAGSRTPREVARIDIVEHRPTGRVIVVDAAGPRVLLGGLQFADGVALSADESRLYVAETGAYRIVVHHLTGPRQGETAVFADNLPGHPAKLSLGEEGRLWVGLVAGRTPLVDRLASRPFLRRALLRLPRAAYDLVPRRGHLVAFDPDGRVAADLQDPLATLSRTTSALELGDTLWVGSLDEISIGRIDAWKQRLRAR